MYTKYIIEDFDKYACRTQADMKTGKITQYGTVTGPGSTIQSDYEPMKVMIQRILAGQVRHVPEIYDVDENMTDDEAFDQEDITQTDGFDLSDVDEILLKAELARRASGSSTKQASEPNDAPEKKEETASE